jgi:hypothetical protein
MLINFCSLSCFLPSCRLGEPFPFRGRQTLCKYYDNNEILNQQLLQIKSAQTVEEFEKLFDEQLRHNQGFSKSAKSLDIYYDIKDVLKPSKPFAASETCLCSKDLYRFQVNQLINERQRTPSPLATTSNAIKNLNLNNRKNSVEEFVCIASDCYDKCINIYLNNLNDCNRRADIIERQSIRSPTGYTGKRSLRARKINDLSLANRINKLSINLDTHHRDIVSYSLDHFCSAGQSTSSPHNGSAQTMSCNDTNNNSTESTNNQLKDPPKIILSDHSTNQTIQGDNSKEYSDSNGVIDKNCLTIPQENFYTSEARPP